MKIQDFSIVACQPEQSLQLSSCLKIMNDITLDHVNLDRNYIQSLKQSQCMTIMETLYFEISIFIIPRGFQLPLHDHPDMAVFSKLLTGELALRSFSKKSRFDESQKLLEDSTIPVNLELDCIRTVCDKPWLLSPTVGNYHEISAISDCVMLDILLPPYSEPDRPCNFYQAVDTDGRKGWVLKEIEDMSYIRSNLPFNVQYKGFRPSP